jgi:hypothetical protein
MRLNETLIGILNRQQVLREVYNLSAARNMEIEQ